MWFLLYASKNQLALSDLQAHRPPHPTTMLTGWISLCHL